MVSQSFAMASPSPVILDSRERSAAAPGQVASYFCRYSVYLLSASAMKRRGIGFVFWPILSHHELSLDQISYCAIRDWLCFYLFLHRVARVVPEREELTRSSTSEPA